jgi:hypothetical protein
MLLMLLSFSYLAVCYTLRIIRCCISDSWLGFPILCSNPDSYFSFAYSDLAAIRMGMSGSASFQRVRKS